MHESLVTITGNVATDLRHVETDGGLHITSFRLASTPRRFEKGEGWVDGETSYYSVSCWRFLAQNVSASVNKGDPVVVTGTLRVRQWEKDGKTGLSTEIDARVVGHDLSRGLSRFTKVTRTRAVGPEEDEALREHGEDGEGGPGGRDAMAGARGYSEGTGEIYAPEVSAA